jgi:TRAP-type mannitol/chloroaromatic compound transport system permease small subunit
MLISVTETTNGYYIPHKITDEAFDYHFGKKEIVVVDNIKYEKVQFTEKYSVDLPLKLMFFIPAVLEVSYGPETVIVDANIFQAFSPLVYLEENNVINTQWTIFRVLN